VPTIDLPNDEPAAVTAAVRRVIAGDRYPHVPRLDPLRAALARLDAAAASADPQANKLSNLKPTAAPAKADKRVRR
jgi:hypothetical protein